MPMPPAIIMICEKFLPIYRSDSSNPSHASSTGGSGPPLPTSKSKPFGSSLSIPLSRVALEVLGELAEVADVLPFGFGAEVFEFDNRFELCDTRIRER